MWNRMSYLPLSFLPFLFAFEVTLIGRELLSLDDRLSVHT